MLALNSFYMEGFLPPPKNHEGGVQFFSCYIVIIWGLVGNYQKVSHE